MSRVPQTLLGIALIAAGIAGWFLLDHRGEMVVLALVCFGGFLVSKSDTLAAMKAIAEFLGGVKDGLKR